jgi:hypothetical protein
MAGIQICEVDALPAPFSFTQQPLHLDNGEVWCSL